MSKVEYLNYEVLEENEWSVEDDDLFQKAEELDLDEEDFGSFEVSEDEFILEAAESEGYEWPFSCRAGACANCAAVIKEGEINMDMQQILSDEEVNEKDVRLTCIGTAETETVKIIYNAKHLDYLNSRVVG